jgi:hypothetical protein
MVFDARKHWGFLFVSMSRELWRPSIARTVLEDICDKQIRIQSYCAVARLHSVRERDGRFVARDIVY